MKSLNTPFVVGVVQAAPVHPDRDAAIDKTCELVLEAGQQGARLVAFPESFIPFYPEWIRRVPAGAESVLNELYAEFLVNAVAIPGDPFDRICRAARRAKTYVVIGVSERNVQTGSGSLFNTLVYIDAQGQIIGKHRKLVTRGGEGLVWAQGDGSTLNVHDTPFGKMGGLIGGENYMPLARYALYASGVQIYIATTSGPGRPWLATLQHIAKEGGVLVLSPGTRTEREDTPHNGVPEKDFSRRVGEPVNVGEGTIVDPEGKLVEGILRTNQEILYAEIDLHQMRGSKWKLDVAGHSARPDIFQLAVNRSDRELVSQNPRQCPELPDEIASPVRGI